MHKEPSTKNQAPAATPLIFVYGTLRRGGTNHFRMAGMDFISSATVHGMLYRVDWYPALILNPDAPMVRGEIYQINDTSLPALDEYEGAQYHRVRTTATDTRGQEHEVWIWEWIDSTETLQPIPDGDWLHSDGASFT